MSTAKKTNFTTTGSMPFKILPGWTCIINVHWNNDSYYENRLTLYGPHGEPIWQIKRSEQPPQRQLDNNSNAPQTYTLFGDHLVPGQTEWLNDMAKVLSRHPSNIHVQPTSMVIGFEDHGDQEYNDIHVNLTFNNN